MSRIVTEPVPGTPNLDFLHGKFGMGSWRIPYFATTLTLEAAAQFLHLPSDIPGGEHIHWSISELYQRNIDWRRVSRQIAPYLRATDVPQFFNSITIALLPYDRRAMRIAETIESVAEWHPPELQNSELYRRELTVGPIRLGFWDDWQTYDDPGFSSGRLRWNINEIFAVALDGQHRLAAIKEVISPTYAEATSRSRVPVLLLLFQPEVGFMAPGKPPTVEVLRKLFIDLNKHARTVNRARQILLDDRDPLAVSVHAVLEPNLEEDIASLDATPPKLPLSLVDWFTEQAKFDAGPHLTTVLGLDWIVGKALETSPIPDMTAYSSVASQLAKLESGLRIDLKAARQRLEEVKTVKLTPFNYYDEELDRVGSAFSVVWAKPLCSLLSRFAPYASLISLRLANGSLSLDWQEWHRLQVAKENEPFEGNATIEYRRFMRSLIERDHPVAEDQLSSRLVQINQLKKDNLAFNVVFQRSLAMAFFEYLKIPDSYVAQLTDEYAVEEDEEPDFDIDLEALDEEQEEGAVASAAEESFAESAIKESYSATSSGADLQQARANQLARRSEEFLKNLNGLIEVFEEYLWIDAAIVDAADQEHMLWAGCLRKPEGAIDFTLGASTRASDLIFLSAAMSTLYRSTSGAVDFADLWAQLLGVMPESSSFVRRMRRAFARMTSVGRETLAVRILKARGDVVNSTAATRVAEVRLRFLWDRVVESVDGT